MSCEGKATEVLNWKKPNPTKTQLKKTKQNKSTKLSKLNVAEYLEEGSVSQDQEY